MPSFKSLRSCSICAWPIRPLPLTLRVVTGSFPGRWLESRNAVKPRCAPSPSPAPSSAPGVAVCSGISRLSPRASGAAWLLRPLPSLLGLTLPVSAALSLTSVKLLTMSTMASLTLRGLCRCSHSRFGLLPRCHLDFSSLLRCPRRASQAQCARFLWSPRWRSLLSSLLGLRLAALDLHDESNSWHRPFLVYGRQEYR